MSGIKPKKEFIGSLFRDDGEEERESVQSSNIIVLGLNNINIVYGLTRIRAS